MMINNPAAFNQKARDWAIRFANAPTGPTGSSTSTSTSTSTTANPRGAEERRREELRRQLQGYDEQMVERFISMGFPVVDIVSALRSTGIPVGQTWIREEDAQRVAEKLLGL